MQKLSSASTVTGSGFSGHLHVVCLDQHVVYGQIEWTGVDNTRKLSSTCTSNVFFWASWMQTGIVQCYWGAVYIARSLHCEVRCRFGTARSEICFYCLRHLIPRLWLLADKIVYVLISSGSSKWATYIRQEFSKYLFDDINFLIVTLRFGYERDCKWP